MALPKKPTNVGEKCRYSNYGLIVLGRVVEAVSGMKLMPITFRAISSPLLDMRRSGFEPESARLPNRSNVYTEEGGRMRDVDDTLPFRGSPAGGGYSTAADLLRFANALQGYRLLDPALPKLLTSGGVTLANGSTAPYDFRAKTSDGDEFIGHSGGGLGEDAELRIFPRTGYCVIVLSNVAPPLTGTSSRTSSATAYRRNEAGTRTSSSAMEGRLRVDFVEKGR